MTTQQAAGYLKTIVIVDDELNDNQSFIPDMEASPL